MKRLLTIAGVFVALSAGGQQDMDNVKIRTVAVAEGLYMLLGAGGNIGLFAGDDGVFMIDDQFAPLTPKIMAAVEELTGRPVDMLFNTHWHFDHTGGNENFGKAGAQIFAHDNVRVLMSEPQTLSRFGADLPAAPEVALPVEELTGRPVDMLFNTHGHINGLIEGTRQVLDWADDDTKIMPGHGQLSNRAELKEFHDMLVESRDRVQAMLDDGKTPDEIVAAAPLADLDARLSSGFIDGEGFTRAILAGLTGT